MRTNKEHVAIRETSVSAAYFMEFEVEDGGRGRRSGLRFVLSFSPFDGLLRYGGFLVRVWEEARSRERLHLMTHGSSMVS